LLFLYSFFLSLDFSLVQFSCKSSCTRVANSNWKKSPKTQDFSQKNPLQIPPKNPLKFPKNTFNSPKMWQILCNYLVINNLKNRAEHVLGRWGEARWWSSQIGLKRKCIFQFSRKAKIMRKWDDFREILFRENEMNENSIKFDSDRACIVHVV
jgi:hypothetical protein